MVERDYHRSWGTHLVAVTTEIIIPGSKSRSEWTALGLNEHEVRFFRRETLEQQLLRSIQHSDRESSSTRHYPTHSEKTGSTGHKLRAMLKSKWSLVRIPTPRVRNTPWLQASSFPQERPLYSLSSSLSPLSSLSSFLKAPSVSKGSGFWGVWEDSSKSNASSGNNAENWQMGLWEIQKLLCSKGNNQQST